MLHVDLMNSIHLSCRMQCQKRGPLRHV